MEQQAQQRQPFSFSGNGGEYFRIWIVNLCLSVLTLGIYSAWAKVRRLQYFYRHTSLAESSFDYHGDPKAILKGRILAVGMFVLYSIAGEFSMFAGLAVFALIMAVMPWLLVRSLQFQLHNTSFRGLRFSFHGKTGDAYLNFLLLPVAAYATLGLLLPLVHQQITRYVRNNSQYGDMEFQFHAGGGAFYKPYIQLFLISIAALVGGIVLIALLVQGGNPFQSGSNKAVVGMIVAVLAYLALMAFAIPFLSARLQNIVWNNTTLGPHAFESDIRARDLFGVMLSNIVLIVLTLGLYKPYADIRLARCRIERIRFLAAEDLETVLAEEHVPVAATGEEMADVFDLDVAF